MLAGMALRNMQCAVVRCVRLLPERHDTSRKRGERDVLCLKQNKTQQNVNFHFVLLFLYVSCVSFLQRNEKTPNNSQVRKGHTDYVRALAASPSSPDTWISGSYDHTVRVWDTRQPKENVLELNHGAPVEACLFLPGGGLCVSAGGNDVKVRLGVGGGGGHFGVVRGLQVLRVTTAVSSIFL